MQACAAEADKDPHFGDAVRNNITVQLANPNAPSGQPMTANGEKAAVAQGRYATDKVKTPPDVDTKENSGGGSSGTSGNN
jgi:hypothetical protein